MNDQLKQRIKDEAEKRYPPESNTPTFERIRRRIFNAGANFMAGLKEIDWERIDEATVHAFTDDGLGKDLISKIVQSVRKKVEAQLDPGSGLKDEWISVHERLPEIREPVLIITDYFKMATAYIVDTENPTYGWTDLMRSEHSYGSVTHWMKLPKAPLPSPPKTKPTREDGGNIILG